jgi:catechol 2,3-dioxygenase-like lactoylglutathione lyase family enzyme
MISGIHHTGFLVSNMDKSLAFYRDLIGMELFANVGLQDGPEVPLIMGVPNAKVTIVMLQKEGRILELIQMIQPVGKPIPKDTPYAQVGHGHIGFCVDDIQKAYNKLKKNGVPIVLPPQIIPGVQKFFYFRDPDGYWVEMVQPL